MELKRLLTQVRAGDECLPESLPLPHPSPRNRLWLKRNAWFAENVVPSLRQRIAGLL